MTYEELIKELFWEVRNAEIDPEDPTIKALIQAAYDYGLEEGESQNEDDLEEAKAQSYDNGFSEAIVQAIRSLECLQ